MRERSKESLVHDRESWSPRKILAGTDLSAAGNAAVRVAANLARRLGANLELLHASHADDRSFGQQEMKKLASRVDAEKAEIHLLRGDPVEEVNRVRQSGGVDLAVIGAKGLSSIRRFLLGSVSEQMLRRPGAPLLLINHAPPGDEFKRILICVEDPDLPTPWLRIGFQLANKLRSEVILAHVLPYHRHVSDGRRVEMYPETAGDRLKKLGAAIDPTVPQTVRMVHGDPVLGLKKLIREERADLVVMGAESNPNGDPGLVPDRIAHMGCPAILLVWESPRSTDLTPPL